MERLKAYYRAAPKRTQVDNDSKFISKVLDLWAYDNDVTLDFSRLEKPTDNAFTESFNGGFRDEFLNAYRFLRLDNAQSSLEHYLTS